MSTISIVEAIREIYKLLYGEYYVLPSSHHEVMILPESVEISLDEMSEMVKNDYTYKKVDYELLTHE